MFVVLLLFLPQKRVLHIWIITQIGFIEESCAITFWSNSTFGFCLTRKISEKDLAMSPSHMWQTFDIANNAEMILFFRKQCVLKNFFIRNYLCIKINMLHIPHMSYFTNTLIQALFLTIFSLLGWKANISNREHTLSCHLSRST